MYAITDLASRAVNRASRGFVATTDGEQLYYEDMGNGPTLLFVHGWAMNTEFWEHQTADLVRQGHRCVAYDQRGFGRSPQRGIWAGDGLMTEDLRTLTALVRLQMERLHPSG